MRNNADRDSEMKKIQDEVLNLTTSPLYSLRVANNVLPVVGEGSHTARIMLIGEAPGRNEAKTGRPFIGAAGKILIELMESVGLKREDVYITSIVKDRPPQNRDPLPEEIEAYGPFLDRQIDIIQPEILVTLGRYAMQYIMKTYGAETLLEPISKAHGKSYDAKALYGPIKIIPLYHPAAVIYNRSLTQVLKDDFQIVKKYL